MSLLDSFIMEGKPDVEEVTSPSRNIQIPEGTPSVIRKALQVAASCQFCDFVSELEEANSDEYTIEAVIGPDRIPLFGSQQPRYRVRFLIPKSFPYSVVQTIPIDPLLRWNYHQNGDWPLEEDSHANIICPPLLSDIYAEELLLPYIRHAYLWITEAIGGNLIRPEQRYEFPHLIKRTDKKLGVYLEGGADILPWLNEAQYGRALLRRVDSNNVSGGLFRVTKLCIGGKENDGNCWELGVRKGAFGEEKNEGWAPWVLFGDPVVEKPHRPPITWTDFPSSVERNVWRSLQDVYGYKHRVPILLVAFTIPEKWGDTEPSGIIWKGVDLQGFDPKLFDVPKKGGFRRNQIQSWPRIKRFKKLNHNVKWFQCTDISKTALVSRSEPSFVGIDGQRIAIVGVGAVGSILVKALSKHEPSEMFLVDKEVLKPGNLVRHESLSFQVEASKALAMSQLVTPISSTSTVNAKTLNVTRNPESAVDLLRDYDIIVDASGDFGVHRLLSDRTEFLNKVVIWCYVKPGPDFGVVVLRRPGSRLTLDKAESLLEDHLDDELWNRFVGDGQNESGLVWPEPGCHHPTFQAPFHRLRMIVDGFLTTILAWFDASTPCDLITLFYQQPKMKGFGLENRICEQIEHYG